MSPEAPVPVFNFTRKEKKNGMASNVKNNLESLGVQVISFLSKDSKKIRYIDERHNQHLLRVDDDAKSSPLEINTDFPKDIDGVVVSDYNKGFVSYELIEQLVKLYNVPIFIDTKKNDLSRFEGCFVKINEQEFDSSISSCSDVIVTHGGSHVTYHNKKFQVPRITAFDVCGAGDTFLASLAFCYLLVYDMDLSIEFAIRSSTVTVQHVGVYSPSLQEILK